MKDWPPLESGVQGWPEGTGWRGGGQLLGCRIFARGLQLPSENTWCLIHVFINSLNPQTPGGSPAGPRMWVARLSKALLALLRSGTRAKSVNTRWGEVGEVIGAGWMQGALSRLLQHLGLLSSAGVALVWSGERGCEAFSIPPATKGRGIAHERRFSQATQRSGTHHFHLHSIGQNSMLWSHLNARETENYWLCLKKGGGGGGGCGGGETD